MSSNPKAVQQETWGPIGVPKKNPSLGSPGLLAHFSAFDHDHPAPPSGSPSQGSTSAVNFCLRSGCAPSSGKPYPLSPGSCHQLLIAASGEMLKVFYDPYGTGSHPSEQVLFLALEQGPRFWGGYGRGRDGGGHVRSWVRQHRGVSIFYKTPSHAHTRHTPPGPNTRSPRSPHGPSHEGSKTKPLSLTPVAPGHSHCRWS